MKKTLAFIFGLATSTALFAAQDVVSTLVGEGVQLHEQGQYDAAIAKYKQAEKKAPKDALVKYEMAFSYHAKHEFDKALHYAKAATKLDTKGIDENLYSLIGTIYDEKGMPDSALAVYRDGFKKVPASSNIPYNATITYMRKNNADSAYAWIQRSINNTRIHEGSYYYAGFLASQVGKWPAFYAYTMYSTFISKKDEIIRDNLSRLYGKTKYLVIKKDNQITKNHPSIKQTGSDSTLNNDFINTIETMLATESLGKRMLYDKDSTSAEQVEFLLYVLEKCVKEIAFADGFDEPIRRFYQGLINERLVTAFVYSICEPVDRPTFAQWLIKNRNEQARLYHWFNKSWLML